MMALEASGDPSKLVVAPGSPIKGWTYLEVMEDAVDYLSWAQNDLGNPGYGGWRYDAFDNGALAPLPSPHPSSGDWTGMPSNPNPGQSDNSVTQWAVLGLMSALGWGVTTPSWVVNALKTWTAYSQAPQGYFWYLPNYYPNIALTASGITQLYYEGVPANDSRVTDAFAFIVSDWTGSITSGSGDDLNIGNLYAMYGVMKACVLYGIVAPSGLWGGMISNSTTSIDWQTDYDNWLVANQAPAPDGNWTTSPEYDPSYYSAEYQVLATEWALLILEKIVPPPLFSVTISPADSTINLCNSVLFTSNVTGGTPAYTYQWYLVPNSVTGATSPSWTFTPTSPGIYYVYLNVTDSKGRVAISNTARVVVLAPVIGGYSISFRMSTLTSTSTGPFACYGAFVAAFGAVISLIQRKKKRETQTA
jgi:hypothetical protein